MIKKAIILLMVTVLMTGCAQAESSDFEADKIVEEVKYEEIEEIEEEDVEKEIEENTDPKEEIDFPVRCRRDRPEA